MTVQEKILLDKYLECVYHLQRMEDKWFQLQEEGINKMIISREFKYEFNSFVNSSRSITFVMQKCFKNKIEGFEEWYSNLQEQFKLNSFAKKLVDIRNKNQKEGNKYPDIIEVRTINKYFQFEITFSPFPDDTNEIIKNLKFTEDEIKKIPENITSINITPISENFELDLTYENQPNETYEEVKTNMEKMLLEETIKEILRRKAEITTDEIINAKKAPNKIRIDDEIYTWDEFYAKCLAIINSHKENCQECIKLFT